MSLHRFGIFSGNLYGFKRDVNACDDRERQVESQRNSNTSGTCADVKDLEIIDIGKILDNHFDKFFRLLSGDKRVGGNFESATKKSTFANDVLYRLVLLKAR